MRGRTPMRSSAASAGAATACCCLIATLLGDGIALLPTARAEQQRNASDSSGGECSSASDGECSSSEAPPSEPRCGLYLASSSIPGAGLGLYTSRPYSVGSIVSPYTSDPCLAVTDMEHATVINDYEWDAGTMGTESEATSPVSLCPGFGMALNGHMHLHNIALSFPDRDNGGGGEDGEDDELHRSKDPGVGAFTRYHNVHGMARVDVPAGSELFLNYGESYFKDRTATLGEIPFEEDFAQNDAIASKFAAFLDMHPDLTPSQSSGALSMLRDAIGGAIGLSKVVSILPTTVEEAKTFASKGTARSMLPESMRTGAWLERHGLCADNLRAGRSTVRQAGRGAFATRSIGAGELVAPAASLYFASASVFDASEKRDETVPGQQQLMLNYCYGHPEMSAVLFPYSPVVSYINHGDPPGDDGGAGGGAAGKGKKANAKLRWSDSAHHKRALLDARLGHLGEGEGDETGSGLLMEYVALRDIAEGEEVLIDYGQEWREAWEEHVKTWTAPDDDAQSYVPAVELNDRTKHADVRDWAVLRTLEEQEGEHDDDVKPTPYPENILTGCYVAYFRDYADFDDVGEEKAEEDDGKVRVELAWTDESYMWRGHHYLRPCDIVERHEVDNDNDDDVDDADDVNGEKSKEEDNYVYTVQIYNLPGTVDGEKVQDFEDVIYTDVPRKAITFMDDLYTSDQHLGGAFRHVIGLPDEMVPDAWRNTKKKGAGEGEREGGDGPSQ